MRSMDVRGFADESCTLLYILHGQRKIKKKNMYEKISTVENKDQVEVQ